MFHRNVYNAKYFIHRQFYHSGLSSYEIRQRFIDYFTIENSHTYIRSSPVVPLHDRSLAFVNAGMNQFREIFLNNMPPPCLRATNSQKCIRVGGKHNDLKDVGLDTYHHTFFEMLGNWSFGDYFKREACELAWKLLTNPPYSIDPRRLYVTYFSGSSQLGLPPDLETKHIWQSLGVQADHILGFGLRDNFWEMGRTGPCGPCTEIHVDHKGGRQAACRVNLGHCDVTELWNIVFIQYNRKEDGSLSPLPSHHIDTGMGFERLVAFLQNKRSNYDTDLFLPLFDTISKSSKAVPYRGKFGGEDEGGLDTAYRVLADHSRMATVAVADNMFPDHNHKLRRVLRKALLVAESSFRMKNAAKLMKDVCNSVADILSSTYPEVGTNLNKVQLVVDHEWEVLQALRGGATAAWRQLVQQDPRLAQVCGYEAPGLCAAYKDLTSADHHHNRLSGDLAYRLYDTHGLQPDLVEELCLALGLEFNEIEFNVKLAEAKEKSVQSVQTSRSEMMISQSCLERLKQSVPVTDDSAKYIYTRTVEARGGVTYVFPPVQGVVQAVVMEGEVVGEAREGRVGLLLDRTCMYHEAGGQQADRGVVQGQGWTLDCDTVLNCAGYLLHWGTLRKTEGSAKWAVNAGESVCVRLDEARRLANMCNHTATHLVNAVIRSMFLAAHQVGSSVTHQQLVFDFTTYGQQVTKDHIAEIDRRVLGVVQSGIPVTRYTVSSSALLAMDDVTLLPGETYPSHNIHLIQIVDQGLVSKEACCGSHVLNTRDIRDWCVTAVRAAGAGGRSLTAVTGDMARQARVNGQRVLEDITSLRQQIKAATPGPDYDLQLEKLESSLQTLKKQVSETVMPHGVREEAFCQIDTAAKLLKDCARASLRQAVEEEMKEVLCQVMADTDCRYLVHCLVPICQLDSVPLQKMTRLCPSHLPVIILAYTESHLKARCCVPQEKVAAGVTAEEWLGPVVAALGGSGGAPRGQDPRLVYNMRPLHVTQDHRDSVIQEALAEANRIAIKLFQR